MQSTRLIWKLRVTALAVASLTLVGCEEPLASDFADSADGSIAKANTCLMSMLYRVEGDTFTFMSGGTQSFGSGEGGQAPYGWRPDIEPRAKSKINLKGSKGSALLLWDDEVVQTFPIDKAFLKSSEVGVLAHDDPDGTRVEFHVYARPECGVWPPDVSTRGQIATLER